MPNGDVTISVIMPAYNAENTIAPSLASALRQEYHPLEVIVVDDGSTDQTRQVVQHLARDDSRVRLLTQPNAGPARARNHGVNEASGRYVAFLDADDRWKPTHLETLASIVRADPDLSWASTAFEYDYGKRVVPEVFRGPLTDGAIANYLESTCRTVTIHTDTVMIDRTVFERFGGFREDWRISEDSDLWYRIGVDHPRLGYSREVSATYRIHENSISTTKRKQSESADYFLRSIDAAIEYAEGKGVLARKDVQVYINHRINIALIASLIERRKSAFAEIVSRYRSRGFAVSISWRTRLYQAAVMMPGDVRAMALRIKALVRRS